MKKYRKFSPLFIVVPIAILFLVSAVVMWLWNWLLPAILGVKIITFWQAMGIFVLSKILFGGFRGGRFGGRKCRNFGGHHFSHKMENFSPEEKEKFKEMWKQRCQHGGFWKRDQEKE